MGRITTSAEETLEVGRELGLSLQGQKNVVICLYGELGAGKTTFAKGLVAGIVGLDPDEIASPTFVYCNCYGDTVYHFDLYRLSNSDEFLAMGFDEALESAGICVIEWAERINDLLPKNAKSITFSHVDETTRRIDGL